MSKEILVIGGGISGLSVLHYLMQKYPARDDIHINLLEEQDCTGGTIKTLHHEKFIFEAGPNGFLSSKPSTLEFVNELGLSDSLLSANKESEEHFISLSNKLYKIPTDLLSFLAFRPLSLWGKMRVFCELLIPKGGDSRETVYDFGKRRFGQNFSELFLDPMVAGIYGGDARRLNLKSAFPRIYEIEQTFGSLSKGMVELALFKKAQANEKRMTTQPRGTLTSFRKGMRELIEALSLRYKDLIRTAEGAESIRRADGRFAIKSPKYEYVCDEVFLCTPAHRAATIIENLNKSLAEELQKIPYVTIAVVGLVYRRSAIGMAPRGFGYLIPSSEKKSVLGVIFNSNIFSNRTDDEHFIFQVMIGGTRNPHVINQPRDVLTFIAVNEVAKLFKIKEGFVYDFFFIWPEAIPQYNENYPQIAENINRELSKIRGLHLAANYLGGVSLNDCIFNAKMAAQKSAL